MTNTVYVSEEGNHQISSLALRGHFLSNSGSKGAKDDQFYMPSGLAIDKYTVHVWPFAYLWLCQWSHSIIPSALTSGYVAFIDLLYLARQYAVKRSYFFRMCWPLQSTFVCLFTVFVTTSCTLYSSILEVVQVVAIVKILTLLTMYFFCINSNIYWISQDNQSNTELTLLI